MKVIDFPKIKSPFVRKHIKGRYLATDEIESGYEWVFEDPTVRAVDKLHGTNACVVFDQNTLKAIHNRKNVITDSPSIRSNMGKQESRFILGVLNSMERGWLSNPEGRVFGELIGPDINGNLHEADRYYFVPFSFLYDRCHWNTWINGSYPKTFDSISRWFEELHSRFSSRHMKKNVLGEGIVFTNEDGKMAKLRRSMFAWYEE